MNQFLKDVLKGLSAKDKYLESKYFYDAEGDVLFQGIMECKEYYPTKCEFEILTEQTEQIVSVLTANNSAIDVIEMGAGDASKSRHLLECLLQQRIEFTYYPIDISENIIQYLTEGLPKELPNLNVHGLNGEYLKMLEEASSISNKPKVVLFLGGNIGNVPIFEAAEFCRKIRIHLAPGDLVLIGFDLKKNPKTILNAYNDSSGLTREFNLNLLKRINKELKGNFVIENFYHYPTYDPGTGACKSYLVSSKEQQVIVADKLFYFAEGEPIFMEIAQKYSVEQTDELAMQTGFVPVTHFFDSKKWFLDTAWKCV